MSKLEQGVTRRWKNCWCKRELCVMKITIIEKGSNCNWMDVEIARRWREKKCYEKIGSSSMKIGNDWWKNIRNLFGTCLDFEDAYDCLIMSRFNILKRRNIIFRKSHRQHHLFYKAVSQFNILIVKLFLWIHIKLHRALKWHQLTWQ